MKGQLIALVAALLYIVALFVLLPSAFWFVLALVVSAGAALGILLGIITRG